MNSYEGKRDACTKNTLNHLLLYTLVPWPYSYTTWHCIIFVKTLTALCWDHFNTVNVNGRMHDICSYNPNPNPISLTLSRTIILILILILTLPWTRGVATGGLGGTCPPPPQILGAPRCPPQKKPCINSIFYVLICYFARVLILSAPTKIMLICILKICFQICLNLIVFMPFYPPPPPDKSDDFFF